MHFVFSSPRARRRLVGLAVSASLAGAIVAVALLVPNRSDSGSKAGRRNVPAQLTPETSGRVSHATRRAIDATLDRFIPAGVGRRSPATAWRLSGPEMKTDNSLREWRKGSSPIPYYPVQGTSFHGWTTVDAGPDYVDFNLLLQPHPGTHLGPWAFSGEMVRRGSRWLVNRIYTVATPGSSARSGPVDLNGAAEHDADHVAPSPSGGPPPRKPALGGIWLVAAGGGLGLAVLAPVGLLLVSTLRGRRLRTRYDRIAGHRQELPPLPAKRP